MTYLNLGTALGLDLSQPQRRHLLNMADALLVCEHEKTLAALHRQFVEAPDASNMADSLCISPWATGVALAAPERNGVPEVLYSNISTRSVCAIPACNLSRRWTGILPLYTCLGLCRATFRQRTLSHVKTYGDILRQRRDEPAVTWLRAALQLAVETNDADAALQRFLRLETIPTL